MNRQATAEKTETTAGTKDSARGIPMLPVSIIESLLQKAWKDGYAEGRSVGKQEAEIEVRRLGYFQRGAQEKAELLLHQVDERIVNLRVLPDDADAEVV